jgi:hypothetical protein
MGRCQDRDSQRLHNASAGLVLRAERRAEVTIIMPMGGNINFLLVDLSGIEEQAVNAFAIPEETRS